MQARIQERTMAAPHQHREISTYCNRKKTETQLLSDTESTLEASQVVTRQKLDNIDR